MNKQKLSDFQKKDKKKSQRDCQAETLVRIFSYFLVATPQGRIYTLKILGALSSIHLH